MIGMINRPILSAIWSEIKPMITKAICNYKFDFRPKLHDTSCNFHFIHVHFKLKSFGIKNIRQSQYLIGIPIYKRPFPPDIVN